MNWYKISQNRYTSPLELYAKSIGVDSSFFHYMGKGDFGEAYETDNGQVLKITSSPSEVDIAKKLIGKNTAFAQIYDVKKINGYNFILQEKLEQDDNIENKFYQIQNLLEEQGLPIQYLGYLDEDELAPEDKILYQELSSFINDIENINREYRNLGIEASDIRPENLGYDKNGNLKAFDIDDKGNK